jgi:hypothetical protein
MTRISVRSTICPLAALGVLLALLPSNGCAQPPATALWARGYSVIPAPQKVTLPGGDVEFGAAWGWNAPALRANHMAVRSLVADLREFHGVNLAAKQAGPTVELAVRPNTVTAATDPALRAQSYRLSINANRIQITGNSDAGLFYGVQTLLQLVKRTTAGALSLPVAEIEDWPAVQLRFLHWDSKHHQDTIATLKRYLDWSARMKVNMIGFELEDKFSYPSHPVIGAPGAYTPAELQEIVNYGLERFIQVVPIVQSPAHFSFVLKHPEFAHLKADGNNYMSQLCNEETYKLIFSMYDDLIAATKGVDYFFVSTDEVYYAGIESSCALPYNPVNRSKALADFDIRAHDHLKAKGRRMLAWLEYPLLPADLRRIPADVIDGVAGHPEFPAIEREMGMRQLVYVSMQGAEYLFPDHFGIDSNLHDPPEAGEEDPLEFQRGMATGRIEAVARQFASEATWNRNPIGVFGAAWDDSGLHNETFWLGWSALAQYGWSRSAPTAPQHAAEFMRLYYGPRATEMIENYRALQTQARAWQRTWDRRISKVRGPGYGNSEGKGVGVKRYDETLNPPPLPAAADLSFTPAFKAAHAGFLTLAHRASMENDQLQHALQVAVSQADRNHYNLEVMLSLTRLIGHHWQLLMALEEAEARFEKASAAHKKGDSAAAAGHLTAVYQRITAIQQEGEERYQQLVRVFEKSQYPKGRAVNGRQFLQVMDDTKDHYAGRTPDFRFMAAAEDSIDLTAWRAELLRVIRSYAGARNIPVRGIEGQ